MMVHEFAGAVRTVYMKDHTDHPPTAGWAGRTGAGKESLVVDTRGFNDLSWFDRASNFHSDALHVVERFTPRSADAALRGHDRGSQGVYAAVEDEHAAVCRRVEANAQILEFRCVEFVEDLMCGHLRKEPRKQ